MILKNEAQIKTIQQTGEIAQFLQVRKADLSVISRVLALIHAFGHLRRYVRSLNAFTTSLYNLQYADHINMFLYCSTKINATLFVHVFVRFSF